MTRLHGMLHFTGLIENQAVSGGFTTVILWQKPLSCLGSELRVCTGPRTLTPKRSKKTEQKAL